MVPALHDKGNVVTENIKGSMKNRFEIIGRDLTLSFEEASYQLPVNLSILMDVFRGEWLVRRKRKTFYYSTIVWIL